MRIVSGFLKGQHIKTIQKNTLRPTACLVREAIFDVLKHNNISYHYVLDLFAGIGTFGIEALSQGAKFCAFVEKNFETAQCLKKNLSRLNLKKKGTVFQKDIFKITPLIIQKYPFFFDVIFADPPYEKYPQTLIPLLTKTFKNSKDCIFVIEHHQNICISLPEELRCFIKKQYGQTHISFLCWNKRYQGRIS